MATGASEALGADAYRLSYASVFASPPSTSPQAYAPDAGRPVRGAPQRWHQVHTSFAAGPSSSSPEAAQQQARPAGPDARQHPRLSPYLPSTRPAAQGERGPAAGPLLGRPRAATAATPPPPRAGAHVSVAAAATSAPGGKQLPRGGDAPAQPRPHPRSRSHSHSRSGSGSPSAELAALSDLTLACDSAATCSSAPAEPPTTRRPATPAARGAATPAAADWRAAFRVPLLGAEGQVMGYRQNSRVLCAGGAPGGGAASPPASPHEPDADAVAPRRAETAAPPPPSAAAAALDEFAAAAADPCCGFPCPEDVVPGYLLGGVLGRGGFCTVRKALHRGTLLPAAFKVIDKCRLRDPKDRDRVDREVRVMRQLAGHVGVAQLLECVETASTLYIVMEHCEGGSLLDHVRASRRLGEPEAGLLLQQLLHALQACHARGVVHRDVKLENVLLDGRGGARLIDFGLCGYYAPGKRLRCHCGSPSYAAPEIVSRLEYLAPPVDVWSLGVVLFAMLAGYLPFHAKDKKALSDRIAAGAYAPPAWLSPAASHLVGGMLQVDPGKRLTLDQVWAHPWVQGSPRWEPPGDGPGGLLRAPVDPATGAAPPDAEVLELLRARGEDVAAVARALAARECSSVTAGYWLLREARAAARRGAAPPPPRAAAAAADGGDGSSASFGTAGSGGSSGSSRSSGTMMG